MTMTQAVKNSVKVAVVTAILFIMETLSYFYIAEYFGQLIGEANTLNLQLPIDKIIPWCTPLFVVYIPWPFMWFAVIPLIVFLANGKESYYQYAVNSFLMYIVGTLIYMMLPTTTISKDFIDGAIQTLSPNAPFFQAIDHLSNSKDNIWGSFPSYHNYWASLFVLFALKQGVKKHWRFFMITLGLAISVSTLTLHQHCLMDVALTYAMTIFFHQVITKYRLHLRFEKFLTELFAAYD